MRIGIAFGVVAAMCCLPVLAGHAADTPAKSPAKMSCQDVLVLDEGVRPVAIGWIDGYNSKGKLKSEEVVEDDVVNLDAVAVIEACKKSPTAKVSDVIKKTKAAK
jgi:hypothetical protein